MVEIPKLDQASLEKIAKELKVPFRIRLANASDIDSLLALVNEAYLYENRGPNAHKKPDVLRVNEKGLGETIRNGIVVVATSPEDDKKILGCVEYREIPATPGSSSEQAINAYFAMLAVEEQGHGTGRKLVSIAESIGRFRGRNLMETRIVNHSPNLIDMYSRWGYEPFGRTEAQGDFLIKPTHFILMRKAI